MLEASFAAPLAPKGYINAVAYVDRASMDEPFGTPVPIAGTVLTFERPYLTDDCARLYFAGLGEVLYLQQP